MRVILYIIDEDHPEFVVRGTDISHWPVAGLNTLVRVVETPGNRKHVKVTFRDH